MGNFIATTGFSVQGTADQTEAYLVGHSFIGHS